MNVVCSAAFGDVFANIGCREPQPQASEVFTTFGEAHRSIERYAIKMLKTVKPVSLSTRLNSDSVEACQHKHLLV